MQVWACHPQFPTFLWMWHFRDTGTGGNVLFLNLLSLIYCLYFAQTLGRVANNVVNALAVFIRHIMSQHDYTRLFAVKLILSYRQKYESKSKSLIFDIFFLNVNHTKQNHYKHLFLLNIRKKMSFMEHFPLDWPIGLHTNYNLWEPLSLQSGFQYCHTYQCSTSCNYW